MSTIGQVQHISKKMSGRATVIPILTAFTFGGVICFVALVSQENLRELGSHAVKLSTRLNWTTLKKGDDHQSGNKAVEQWLVSLQAGAAKG